MPLAMSRPWKHPNSGVFWLRKGVPEDLRKIVGKREEKRSLQWPLPGAEKPASELFLLWPRAGATKENPLLRGLLRRGYFTHF